MDTTIKPATPLPWRLSKSGYSVKAYIEGETKIVATVQLGPAAKATDVNTFVQDADYLSHACNAYPQLVAALKKVATDAEYGSVRDGLFKDIHSDVTALLSELGELATPSAA